MSEPSAPSAKSTSQAIQIEGVSKAFGPASARTMALNRADFHAKSGELTMLVGPSGCGKTTLLSIIAGTLTPDSGSINVLGYPLHSMSKSKLTQFRAQHIGFIFQQFNLIPTLSVCENISIPLIINGVNHKTARLRSLEIIDRVGLNGRENERPLKLSGGQQQRVAIARALVHQPPLIICDEPTSALDKDTGTQIMTMIRDIASEPSHCVIVVTHDSRIYHFADRMAEMEDGKILRFLDSPDAIRSAHSTD